MALVLALLNDMFFAAIPAVGFAMVFNVPPKYLPYCALGGAIAHGLRMLLLQQGIQIEWATLAGSTTVGLIGIYWSKKLHVPAGIFTVAAMIPMVPGVYVYKAMIAIVEINHVGFSIELWKIFAENFITGTSIIAALAVGLALPNLIFYRRRPVV
ncbi:threonine/serine exporter family protein [Agaribacterium haliotis]|uniref:threonine/serine exporter family protein n=1 Tax=Agaribacterium haliotis TaxID=2013869 RepID=UPI000BB541BA|nr:threonine/serine exporter family protein [Agaribacterium haliotis]